MSEDFGFRPSQPETVEGFAASGSLKPEAFSWTKGITGAISGVADIAAGAVSMPISGIVGLGAAALGGAEKGVEAVHATQEKLTPSAALEKLGVPKSYLSESQTHQILQKIISAPHDYISVPIADKYHDIRGNALAAALVQAGLDLPAYIASFGLARGAARGGARPRSAETLREEAGYKKDTGEVKPVDTTKYNQAELGFVEEGQFKPTDIGDGFRAGTKPMEVFPDEAFIREGPRAAPEDQPPLMGSRRGGILDPQRKAELEAELNPPTESRRPGQGEVFTGERPYPEAFPGEGVVGRPEPSNRGRDVAPREESMNREFFEDYSRRPVSRDGIPSDAPMGELPQRTRPADQLARPEDMNRAPDEPIPYTRYNTDLNRVELTERGTVGEARAKSAEEYRAALKRGEPIPFEVLKDISKPDLSKGPGARQRGAVDLSVFIDGLKKALLNVEEQFKMGKIPESFYAKRRDELQAKMYQANQERKHSSDPYGKPSPKNIREFHKDFMGKVSDRASEMRETVEQWVKEDKYQWKDGDIVQSKQTGHTFTVTPFIGGRLRKGQGWEHWPTYRLKTMDINREGMHSFDSKVELAHEHFIKLGSSSPSPFTGPGSSQRGAIGTNPAAASLAKKGIVHTIQDFKKFWTEDTKRTLDQALKEDHPNLKPEEMTDIGDKTLLEKGLSNFLIDKQMAIMAQGKGAISTVIKWVVDNQNAINRRLKETIEEHTRAALDPWRSLKKSSPQMLRDMLTTWQENIGKAKLGPESFKSARQWEVYQAISKVITDGLEKTNEARASIGLAPIKAIDNYFPSIRNGDWWVYIHDTGGNLKGAYAYPTRFQANKAHEVLKKDMGVEFDVREPALKKVSEHDLSSLEAFEETLRALHKNDPIAQAIQQRYAYLVGHRGFARTGIHRKGIEGALGFEQGKLGVKNSERVMESYINRQETYIANIERAKLQKQVNDVSGMTWKKDDMGKAVGESTLFKNAPIAKQWIDEYLARSKGADLDQLKGIRYTVDAISTAAGLSRGVVPHFIQKTSSMASLFYLATVRNLIVNMTQPLNAFAKLTDMWQLGDKVSNPVHAFFDGYVEAFSPDAISKEGRAWATKEGFLESAIVNLIEGKLADFKGEGAKLVGEAMRYSLGKVEQHAVRVPIFHAFEKALRQEVPDKMQRFQMAGSLVDNYMVHYDRESSPMVYDKLGSVVGESTRGLKTYAHNTWGQFFEYIGTAKDQSRYAPLATYMGTQALIGGLRGVFLVAEATAAITLINAMFDSDIPTPEQVMLRTGLNDFFIFGGLSTLLGRDISASVSAPSMPQLFNFVPIEFGVNAAKESWNYLHKKASGIATDQDAMKALLAVSPKAMQGWIEALYSEEGGKIPNPRDKMKGNYPVPSDPVESFARFGLGMKSIDEAKINMIVRNTKALLARDVHQKLDALDAIVDRVENKQQIPPELIEKYTKGGGSVANLLPTIKQRLIDRQLDYAQRLGQGKSVTPDKAHKLERLKESMDDDLRKRIDENAGKKPLFQASAEAALEELSTGSMLVKQMRNAAQSKPTDLDPSKFSGAVPGSNYESFSRYRQPHIKTSGFEKPENWNVRGFVDPEKADRVWNLAHSAKTQAHEVTHVDQVKAEKRLGGNMFASQAQEELTPLTSQRVDMPVIISEKYYSKGAFQQERGPLGRDLLDAFKKTSDGKHAMVGGQAKELYAYLRMAEAELPRGKHVWDMPEYKDVFKGERGELRKRMVQELMFPEHTFVGEGPGVPSKSRSVIEQLQRYMRKATQ